MGALFFTVLFVPLTTLGAIVTLAINEKMEQLDTKKSVSVGAHNRRN